MVGSGYMNKKKISLILLVIWMLFIFIMSTFNANESSSQSGIIVSFISNIFSINNIEVLSLIVRKFAHFFEFLVLGILLLNVIINYNKKIYLAYIFGIIYAILDEVHQLFVMGRSCQLTDILIDSLGIMIGIFVISKFVKKI